MQKIKEYRVVSANCMNDIDKQVNRCILEGWQPFGGVSSTQVSEQYSFKESWLFSQALVKYE